MRGLYCEHERLNDSCEDCAYERAQAAGLPLGGPHPSVTRQRNAEGSYGLLVLGPDVEQQAVVECTVPGCGVTETGTITEHPHHGPTADGQDDEQDDGQAVELTSAVVDEGDEVDEVDEQPRARRPRAPRVERP